MADIAENGRIDVAVDEDHRLLLSRRLLTGAGSSKRSGQTRQVGVEASTRVWQVVEIVASRYLGLGRLSNDLFWCCCWLSADAGESFSLDMRWREKRGVEGVVGGLLIPRLFTFRRLSAAPASPHPEIFSYPPLPSDVTSTDDYISKFSVELCKPDFVMPSLFVTSLADSVYSDVRKASTTTTFSCKRSYHQQS